MTMTKEEKEMLAPIATVFTCFCLLVLVVWLFQSMMEARAFNAVTGKNVSTWQAMWIELRVQEQSK